MSVLTELDLKDNWLSSLPEGVADLEQLEYVRLSGNPFRCDCHTRWMKSWLLANQGLVQDWSDIKCSTDESEGRTFTSVADDDFICKPSASLGELAVPIAVPIWLFILVLLAVSVVVFLFRKRIKVCLNIHSGPRSLFPESLSDDALYDVAVVCGFPALVWSLHNVVEPLENDYKCKVFFYSRDSFVGFTLLENVRHCVKNSRRLVVVQGKNWVKDDLLVSAIREALTECRKDIVHFMTVLLHQIEDKDIGYQDIQEYTRRWNCIHTDDKHFTKKLVSHLKSGATGNRENTKHVKAGVPERIVLHDIVAAAETEQDVVSKKDKNGSGQEGFCETNLC
ncbi:hypothetical protein BaRGS_00040442 [Batillaria attramentaria]|uniref:TIR domain-containing protein n=1 Tax=Batillaria attramentaria TaxID=370345 RepID=A0ABD0J0A2_9CAEN